MKKNVVLLLAIMFTGSLFAQAVKDRQVIPVAVTLNQVLRMTITNGGNIEFVFNSIDDYRDGLSAVVGAANPLASIGFYQTDFTVASSTRWLINYGSEQATFIGTDNPGNQLALDNVGFSITNSGTNTFDPVAKGNTAGSQLWSASTAGATEVAALEVYPVVLIEDNDDVEVAGVGGANAGDGTDNSFSLLWRCGTGEDAGTVPMSTESILNQSPSPNPDRYVTNVLFELAVDN
ncbi:MAG: hypothetical protein K9H49_04600 [Bacteroidales bacterium]|nr:hypothetical protein [Bacteroidales bacterium]MCF8389095.1 hypothetical protein [Bacteroidales bacterium]